MAVQSAYRDAQSTNRSKRSAKVYKDLNLNFTKHPVKQNFDSTDRCCNSKEKCTQLSNVQPLRQTFSSRDWFWCKRFLFENMTPFVSNTLRKLIEDTITNFEPRVRLAQDGVRVNPNFDNNQYEVTVEFYIENSPSELVDMTFNLERIR